MFLNSNHTPDNYIFRQRSDYSSSQKKDSKKLLEDRSGEVHPISDRLAKLPIIEAKPDFDQKMAAAFAIELHRETTLRNHSLIQQNAKIQLPETFLDFE